MRILHLGLAIACLSLPATANAQSNPRLNIEMRGGSTQPVPDGFSGYRRSRDIAFRTWKADEEKRLNSYAYRPVLRFAECVSRFDKSAAARVLSTPLKSHKSGNALTRAGTVNRACIVEHGLVHPLLLRAAMAETRLKHGDSVQLGEQRVVGVPAIVDGYPLGLIADCQVPQAPQLVRALLATEPGDPAERQAAETLFGRTAECGTTRLGRLAPTAARLALVEAEYARRFLAGR
jgi:hypothetical protein